MRPALIFSLVVMIKSKELKTKISLTHSLILSLVILSLVKILSFVLVAVMKSKEFKTKISHAHSVIPSLVDSFTAFVRL